MLAQPHFSTVAPSFQGFTGLARRSASKSKAADGLNSALFLPSMMRLATQSFACSCTNALLALTTQSYYSTCWEFLANLDP